MLALSRGLEDADGSSGGGGIENAAEDLGCPAELSDNVPRFKLTEPPRKRGCPGLGRAANKYKENDQARQCENKQMLCADFRKRHLAGFWREAAGAGCSVGVVSEYQCDHGERGKEEPLVDESGHEQE